MVTPLGLVPLTVPGWQSSSSCLPLGAAPSREFFSAPAWGSLMPAGVDLAGREKEGSLSWLYQLGRPLSRATTRGGLSRRTAQRPRCRRQVGRGLTPMLTPCPPWRRKQLAHSLRLPARSGCSQIHLPLALPPGGKFRMFCRKRNTASAVPRAEGAFLVLVRGP